MDSRNYDDYGGVQHVEYCFQVYIYDLHFHVVVSSKASCSARVFHFQDKLLETAYMEIL